MQYRSVAPSYTLTFGGHTLGDHPDKARGGLIAVPPVNFENGLSEDIEDDFINDLLEKHQDNKVNGGVDFWPLSLEQTLLSPQSLLELSMGMAQVERSEEVDAMLSTLIASKDSNRKDTSDVISAYDQIVKTFSMKGAKKLYPEWPPRRIKNAVMDILYLLHDNGVELEGFKSN